MFSFNDGIAVLNSIAVNDLGYMTTMVEAMRYAINDETAAQTLISSINKLMSVGHTREKGIEVLRQVVLDFPVSILEEYSIAWTNHVLNYHPKEAVSARRFQTLALLLDLCHNNQDYNKTVVNNTLPKMVEMCLSVHKRSNECDFSLQCLFKCLKYFPTTMIVYKKKLESFLLSFLDTPVLSYVLEEAAECMLYLNQTGGPGSLGSMHIKNYSDYVDKLVNTMDMLYDSLYETTNEYSEHESDHSIVYEFREIPPSFNDDEKLRILERRLRNVAVFITKAIELKYPVKKSIKPEILLNVLQRGLAVHVHIEESKMKNLMLSTVIHNHQIYLLQILKTCVTCFKENFIRFSTVKIILDYLQRTQNCNCFKGRSEYKIAIYEILELWILNCSEFLESITYEKIIKYIITDITPVKKPLVLHISSSKSQKNNKQHKPTDGMLPHRLQVQNENVCYQALRTLHVLLKNVLLTIKDSTCTVLFETLVKNAFDISVNSYSNPYTCKKNCIMLYKVLIAIFDQQRKSLDLGLAVNILNIGSSKRDVDIANVCTEGLMALEKLCQPTHSSLSLDVFEDDEDVRKSGQKRNRREVEQTDDLNQDRVMENLEENKPIENKKIEIIEDICINKSAEKIPDKVVDEENKEVKDTDSKKIEINEENNEDEDTDCNKIDDIDVIEITENENDDLKEVVKSNMEDDEESIINEDIDLHLQVSEKCEDDEESPTKKVKLSENKADEEEIDVVGDDDEDMLSSFVDEVNE